MSFRHAALDAASSVVRNTTYGNRETLDSASVGKTQPILVTANETLMSASRTGRSVEARSDEICRLFFKLNNYNYLPAARRSPPHTKI